MKLTYRLGSIPATTVLPHLSSCATALGVELEALESASADLYFYEASEEHPRRTGLAHLVDAGGLSDSVAAILLAWAIERQELIKVAPLRHELGNLIVILLGRIMRLKEENTSSEHLTSLQSLHQRLTSLYHDFDRLKVPRY